MIMYSNSTPNIFSENDTEDIHKLLTISKNIKLTYIIKEKTPQTGN